MIQNDRFDLGQNNANKSGLWLEKCKENVS